MLSRGWSDARQRMKAASYMSDLTDKPILITGADGMLATALRRRFVQPGGPAGRLIWTDVGELDICDAEAISGLVDRERPGVIINCAGLTDVDGCEGRRDEAMAVNGHAVGHLARAAEAAGSLLVQISTDFVFSGDAGRPYREDDQPGPLNVYGESKLLGEHQARRAPNHLIVRTSWLYGGGGRNFVLAICRQAAAGGPLRVVADQTGCPTRTDDLAEALLRLLAADARGTFHACGADSTSWLDFARFIIEQLGEKVIVEEISSADLNSPARRPAMSVLDCTKLYEATGCRLPGFRQSLGKYLAEIDASASDQDDPQ